jgi:uncharacterized membrane protein HdeD (DUF308 family)
LTLFWPDITFAALLILFGAYSLVDGVFSIIGAVKAARAHEHWGFLVLLGVTGIAAGLVTLFWPAITAVALIFVIAAWAIVIGILELVGAVRLRRQIQGEWLLALSGVASLVFGVLVTIAPLAGALVIALWVGAYAMVSGVLMVSLGIRLRSWGRRHLSVTGGIPLPAR